MPELPEVETIARQLRPVLTGRTIDGAKVMDASAVEPLKPAAFTRKVKGQKITGVSRRGKYLRVELASGATLVIHLRMTGQLIPTAAKPAADPHLRLFFSLDDDSFLAFCDQRRFGRAFVLRPDEDGYWNKLGPEPLERSFTPARLAGALSGSRAPVKSFLMNQSHVAGIGNIYADEALFEAGIHPQRPAGSLSAAEIQRLVKAIKGILRQAISLNGTSIRTYRDAEGRAGRYQEAFRVHQRQGEPCPRCGGKVEKIRVGGRGTYFCPRCQK